MCTTGDQSISYQVRLVQEQETEDNSYYFIHFAC